MRLLAMLVLSVSLAACGGGQVGDLARQTCADATNGENNTPQVMASGFQAAEDAGISEADYREALLEECAMDPPPRQALDTILEGQD